MASKNDITGDSIQTKAASKQYLNRFDWAFCKDPGHTFPSHLYIQPGTSYTHICPKCGYEQTVVAPMISC